MPTTIETRILSPTCSHTGMKLSLSVRVAEAPCKTRLNVPFADVVQLAAEYGYSAICLRASAGGIGTPREELLRMRDEVARAGLVISMVTADSDVPLNNEHGPDSLQNIGPSLDVAEAVGCDLIRVCLKQASDIEPAKRAADLAAERGIRLAHQCHTTTLFEEVEPSIALLKRINRRNFGLIYEPINLLICGQPYGLADARSVRALPDERLPAKSSARSAGAGGARDLVPGRAAVSPHPPLGARRRRLFGSRAGTAGDRLRRFRHRHQAYAELMGPEEATVKSADYLRSLGVDSNRALPSRGVPCPRH